MTLAALISLANFGVSRQAAEVGGGPMLASQPCQNGPRWHQRRVYVDCNSCLNWPSNGLDRSLLVYLWLTMGCRC